MATTLLAIENLAAGYGRNLILQGVDLRVEQGTITCLIGPNGAGKSTVLKTVSGLLRPSNGSISFAGVPIGGMSPRSILELGAVHVPQERSLFPAMSVWDNLLMGGFILRNREAVHRRAAEVAESFPLIASRRRSHAGSLSGGEQKIVEIARALMLDPAMLLMDEPSTGLDPRARHLVFETIQELNAAGRTILLVEQNARSGLAISHRGAVMETGRVRLEGTGAGLLGDPQVARLYLGTAGAAPRTT